MVKTEPRWEWWFVPVRSCRPQEEHYAISLHVFILPRHRTGVGAIGSFCSDNATSRKKKIGKQCGPDMPKVRVGKITELKIGKLSC
jgi:hypothetical protein